MLQRLGKSVNKYLSSVGVSTLDVREEGSYLKQVERDLEYASSMRELYPYISYADDIFYCEDNVIGSLIEVTPKVGIDEVIFKTLEHYFRDEFPSNYYMQFLFVASHKVGRIMSNYREARKSTPIINVLTEKRIKFCEKLALNFENEECLYARDFKIYIVFSTQKNKELEEYRRNLKRFTAKLKVSNLNPRISKPQVLLDLIDEIVCMRKDVSQAANKYDPQQPLKNQLSRSNIAFKVSEEEITHIDQGLSTKIYNISHYPKEFSMQEMINLIGDSERDQISIPARFIFSYTIANDISQAEQGKIMQKGTSLIEQSKSRFASNEIREEASEWPYVLNALQKEEKLFNESFQVMITAKTKYIDEAEQGLITLFNLSGFKLDLNKRFMLPSLKSILPFVGTGGLFNTLKLYGMGRICTSSEVMAKLPLHSEWTGMMPGLLFFGRRGQIFNFNPFQRISSGNYNIAIFAPSGGGKSVGLQELATSMLASNVKVFALETGNSFKNICNLLKGEHIKFDSNSSISLNPFSEINKVLSQKGLTNDSALQDMLMYSSKIISAMCGCNDNKYLEIIIDKAIHHLASLGEISIDLLKEHLEEVGTIESNKLAHLLYPYTKFGQYGKYFIKPANITFKNLLTVIEFEDIQDKHFLSVIVQFISLQIVIQILLGDRSQKFMLILDEAWKFLDYFPKLIEEFARTFRKLGGSLVTCVQNYNDFLVNNHTKSILGNSSWTIMFKQDAKDLDALKTSEAFKDIIPMIESIRMKPGFYSEALIYSSGVRTIGRLVLDPYARTLYSTDDRDFVFINECAAKGISTEEAITKLSEQKYGEGL